MSTSNLRMPGKLFESDFADFTHPVGGSRSPANLFRWVTHVIAWLGLPLDARR